MITYLKLLKLVKKGRQPERIRVNGIEFFWDDITIPYSPCYFNNNMRTLEQYIASVFCITELAKEKIIEPVNT